MSFCTGLRIAFESIILRWVSNPDCFPSKKIQCDRMLKWCYLLEQMPWNTTGVAVSSWTYQTAKNMQNRQKIQNLQKQETVAAFKPQFCTEARGPCINQCCCTNKNGCDDHELPHTRRERKTKKHDNKGDDKTSASDKHHKTPKHHEMAWRISPLQSWRQRSTGRRLSWRRHGRTAAQSASGQKYWRGISTHATAWSKTAQNRKNNENIYIIIYTIYIIYIYK